MKAVFLMLVLAAACLAADIEPSVRLCGARLAEALNIVCMRKDTNFSETSSLYSLYDDQLKQLIKARNDAHPSRRPSLVEHCCVKSCPLIDMMDYCPQDD